VDNNCEIYRVIDFISKKWTVSILLELFRGSSDKIRYSVIKRNLSEISSKILSARLKELEKESIIIKKIDTTCFPIKCEYYLTKSGIDLIQIIKEIKEWTFRWKVRNKLCDEQDCKVCNI